MLSPAHHPEDTLIVNDVCFSVCSRSAADAGLGQEGSLKDFPIIILHTFSTYQLQDILSLKDISYTIFSFLLQDLLGRGAGAGKNISGRQSEGFFFDYFTYYLLLTSCKIH